MADVQEFVEIAMRERARVERLLACPAPRFVLFDQQCRRHAAAADVQWCSDITDPEFRKNLRIFCRLIDEVIEASQRARWSSSSGDQGVGQRGSHAPASEELRYRLEELGDRIQLPRDVPLTLEVLLGRRFALDRLLAEVGDSTSIRNRAAELAFEPPGTLMTWEGLFEKKTSPLAVLDGADDLSPLEKTRGMVLQLLAAKEAQDMPGRARRQLKLRALRVIIVPFLLSVVAFAFATRLRIGAAVLLPVTAGVTGAALGMLVKLRDELDRGSQMRGFTDLFFAQLLIGASAGLVVSIAAAVGVIKSEFVTPAGVAIASFVVGFSEAAFIRLLRRFME